jgi:hypothetical protein
MPPIRRPSREALVWLRAEDAAQRRRCRALAAAAQALAPRRAAWLAEFLARIQTRGLDVGGGARRRVRPEEMPARPKRKLRVVY